jgi:hypothetical protein
MKQIQNGHRSRCTDDLKQLILAQSDFKPSTLDSKPTQLAEDALRDPVETRFEKPVGRG